jgi:hypothetical protein
MAALPIRAADVFIYRWLAPSTYHLRHGDPSDGKLATSSVAPNSLHKLTYVQQTRSTTLAISDST